MGLDENSASNPESGWALISLAELCRDPGPSGQQTRLFVIRSGSESGTLEPNFWQAEISTTHARLHNEERKAIPPTATLHRVPTRPQGRSHRHRQTLSRILSIWVGRVVKTPVWRDMFPSRMSGMRVGPTRAGGCGRRMRRGRG